MELRRVLPLLLSHSISVASLTMVSFGAVTDGVTIFFRRKSDDVFLLIVLKSGHLFSHHSHPLFPFQLIVCSVFFVNSPSSKWLSLGCHLLDVHLPPVTPLHSMSTFIHASYFSFWGIFITHTQETTIPIIFRSGTKLWATVLYVNSCKEVWYFRGYATLCLMGNKRLCLMGNKRLSRLTGSPKSVIPDWTSNAYPCHGHTMRVFPSHSSMSPSYSGPPVTSTSSITRQLHETVSLWWTVTF